MTSRGTIRITSQCIKAERTTVNGVESYWLRGEMRTPLLTGPEAATPIIDQLRIRTSIDTSGGGSTARSHRRRRGRTRPTEPVEPFGSQPRSTSLFYARSDAVPGPVPARGQPSTMQVSCDLSGHR